MDIRVRHYQNVAILAVDGRLDTLSAPDLAQAIKGQTAVGCYRLVIDLRKVDYLNSAGIKALAQGAQQTRQQGGDLRIANARAHVKFVLHLAGVDSIIKLYANVVAATASYFPGPIPGELPGSSIFTRHS